VVNEIITVFCFVDEFLKTTGQKNDKQAQMSQTEIITAALIAIKYFGGNYAKTLEFLSLFWQLKERQMQRMLRFKKLFMTAENEKLLRQRLVLY
jgi:hypothetical protein